MEKISFSAKLLHPKYWLVWCAMGLWWLVIQVLPFRCQMWLGAKIGRLAAKLSERRRIITRKNIDLCFPELDDEAKEKLFWQTMESTGKGLFDTGIAWFWPYRRLKKVIDIRGVEHLLQAKESGQGILLLTYHFTSLEMGCAALNRHYPYLNRGVYRPHGNPVYDYIMRKGRERHGKGLEALPRKDVRGMVRALRKGNLLFFLPDQDYGHKYSTFVPFFNVDAATITSPSQLSKLGSARVFSMYCIRKQDGSGYLVEVFPEHLGYGEGDEREDALTMNRFLEQRIREYPEQYLWVHRRFKSQLDSNDDFYGLQALRSFRRNRRKRSMEHARKEMEKNANNK